MVAESGPLLAIERKTSSIKVEKPIALLSMPTLSGEFPSFQLGLLRPTLERAGIPTQNFSLYMYFGAHVGWKLNNTMATVWPSMIGEWIWAREAFPEGPADDDAAYFERFERNLRTICDEADADLIDLRRIREEKARTFLDFCLESTDWSRFSMIGFSCVFQQTMASLAFARRLKERHRDIPIIFGGASFEDDIAEELLRNASWVDFIHCGDADETLPHVVDKIANKKVLDGQKGLMWIDRESDELQYAGRTPNLAEMDQTPVPNYDEYFYARDHTGYTKFAGTDEVMLPIETARGCWWGAKNHCTFCGLNRQGMAFRAKSPDNVLDMLRKLAGKYNQNTFDAIDNIIDLGYIEGVLGRLADERTDLRFHFEVRPSLKRDQLRRMRDGGLYSVQSGVEALNTNVLSAMNKRMKGIKSVQFLKWCTYYGIHNIYFILMGFAGERDEDYVEQAETVRRIWHLQPPSGITKARADRGSPMFEQREEHQVSNLRPADCYPFLFPERFDLDKVSYYYEHDRGGVVSEARYQTMFDAVGAWRASWKSPGGKKRPRPQLRYRKLPDTLIITDSRGIGRHPKNFEPADPITIRLEGTRAKIYEALLDAMPDERLCSSLKLDPDEAEEHLDVLDRLALVRRMDGMALALALPQNPRH